MLSDDFDNLQSLPNIAMTIRRSINRSRERTFLEPYLAIIDGLMRKIAHENLQCRFKQYPNEIIINSNLKYDWADLVDFGHTDKCRFYTTGAGPFYLRVFRPNPIHNGTNWIKRDRQGAEVAFLVGKNIKSRLLDAWHKDINENFAQWENNTQY
ncbi:unnamed protein product [Rotaria sordida]|uniref:Uncharacterized protein n=1 Tax=Rotaria sordida TaxID=392033 RepID=A0A815BYU8_9BILA|nr:unnamed protein product [Rotaria sordida]